MKKACRALLRPEAGWSCVQSSPLRVLRFEARAATREVARLRPYRLLHRALKSTLPSKSPMLCIAEGREDMCLIMGFALLSGVILVAYHVILAACHESGAWTPLSLQTFWTSGRNCTAAEIPKVGIDPNAARIQPKAK
eukprot:995841-Pleurochrysis_carterae.AAC.2